MQITEFDARTAVDDVCRATLVSGTDTLRLADDGRVRYQRIRDGNDDISHRLYRHLPHDDLVTAGRMLDMVTDRARVELAKR